MTLWLSGKPRCCAEDSGLPQIYGSVPAIPNIILSSDPWDIGKLGGDGQGPTSFSPPYFSQISSQYHIFCVEKSAFFVSLGSHFWFNIKCAKIFFWIVTPIVTRCPWLCGADFLHFSAALRDDELPDSFVINNATPPNLPSQPTHKSPLIDQNFSPIDYCWSWTSWEHLCQASNIGKTRELVNWQIFEGSSQVQMILRNWFWVMVLPQWKSGRCVLNKLARLRRCVSRVHLAKIHFGNWSLKAVGHM